MTRESEEPSVNIFNLLSEESSQKKKLRNKKTKNMRAELLDSMDVKDLFEEGSINIDMKTCRGIECNLCVKACPTNALYWKAGEIGIMEDLCIHCTACVANCIIDDCIRITRTRPDGKTEKFSNPKEVLQLQKNISTKKRKERVKSLYSTVDEYLERHGK